MTAPTKDKLVTISASVIGSILLMFLGLYTTGMINSRQDMQLKIDSKVDKFEYDRHCLENKEAFKLIQETQTEQLNKINTTLEKLFEQNATRNEQQGKMQTDLEWIKKKL